MIPFDSLLLVCCINSQKDNYRCSTREEQNNKYNKITIIIIIINKKEEITSKCRLCKEYKETTDHLTSGCPILAKNEYIIRHDKLCTHLRYSICKTLGI
jgi:hypothetical protein